MIDSNRPSAQAIASLSVGGLLHWLIFFEVTLNLTRERDEEEILSGSWNCNDRHGMVV